MDGQKSLSWLEAGFMQVRHAGWGGEKKKKLKV